MMEFYICRRCGNLVEKIVKAGGTLVCCGEPMEKLEANSTVAATEKHYPVVELKGNVVKVKVSDVTHPMLPEHWIQWIALETEKGVQRVDLEPGEEPVAEFALADGDKAVAAYEHCNLHGLWKTDI